MSSNPVTETVVLQLLPGVALEDVYAGGSGSGTPADELTKLGNTLKAQNGFIRQFWGHQVENPSVFVWSIDWESFEQHKAFINSDGYNDFMGGVVKVFDVAAAPPAMMHTAFTTDATEARKAPVTEVAFFMISKDSDEATRTNLEDAVMPVIKACTGAGKASAFALGWVFEDQVHPAAHDGLTATLQLLLGWPAVEDHMNFRQDPDFLKAVTPVRTIVLPAIQGKSMFHVKFQAWE